MESAELPGSEIRSSVQVDERRYDVDAMLI
jgi:hypothetical protein